MSVRAATGPGSNVTVNLKAREAVALAPIIEEAARRNNLSPEAADALEKLWAASQRATKPWSER